MRYSVTEIRLLTAWTPVATGHQVAATRNDALLVDPRFVRAANHLVASLATTGFTFNGNGSHDLTWI